MGERLMKIFLTAALIFGCMSFTKAQTIVPGKSLQVGISYDKTLHLIYSTSIRYFDIGSDAKVAVDRPEDVKNVIRVKAQERNFTGNTNLSVVTSDGVFHSYTLCYRENPEKSYIREGSKYVEPRKIAVCKNNSTHLIFPGKIKYIDFGDNTISVEKPEQVDNIIRMQAVEEKFPETNMSVITEDNAFYTVDVDFSSSPEAFSYVIGDTTATNKKDVAIFNDVEINENDQERISRRIINSKREIYNLAVRKGSVNFSVWNVYVHNNTLFVRLQLNNKSSINYDIDFIKYYVTDKKLMKKTAMQETVIDPLFQNGYSPAVKSKSKMDWVVAFEKFTIPEDRQFVIEIQEKNGGRHFKFVVPPSDILEARILPGNILYNNK